MRRLAVVMLCALGASASAEAAERDAWSGLYRHEWVANTQAAQAIAATLERPEPSQLTITRAPDADPAKLMKRYQSDLARWTLAQASGGGEKSRPLRRFLPREYAGWGWTALHEAGRMECLDGGHLFLCKTTPDTTVAFGPEGPGQETLRVKTGVFGIVLHAGAFELKKLD
ncbi:hypothetical protein [Variovorax sp. N23]|uniref:hypothetical protein n=1 Tax=Variovorax sp. N23 TaxID=2980555 RepID=UPI0021C691EA|nr:hypothetical protein [Variovorax sp. N23]MCU4119194.1 hypothetical protein [Variovorax sp. N23]